MKRLYYVIKAKIQNYLFYRALAKAPVKKLGNIYVKEVWGTYYAVDKPLITASDMEVLG
jgi:hypothetical protein